MSSGKPIIRQISWLFVIPQFLLMGLLILLFGILIKPFIAALYMALFIYLLISYSLRLGIPRSHRKGVSYFKENRYSLALEEFKKSYEFFTEHIWIDKYRFITLMSASKISYTEMALLNIAFCYGQMGQGEMSKKYYEISLHEFPDSQIAKTSLNMISSFENKEDE